MPELMLKVSGRGSGVGGLLIYPSLLQSFLLSPMGCRWQGEPEGVERRWQGGRHRNEGHGWEETRGRGTDDSGSGTGMGGKRQGELGSRTGNRGIGIAIGGAKGVGGRENVQDTGENWQGGQTAEQQVWEGEGANWQREQTAV